ncbi:hypothetical protein EVAR_22915_1 [Eumeta japonica]|uniref:Uncharacterized protein n=1 Tax=Eumeta variegata TaxID=151549 RepID=A0A4C1UW36_EUMVA|nr:hypothetical protein EVAR_22915_1 [Eumeta japonica]
MLYRYTDADTGRYMTRPGAMKRMKSLSVRLPVTALVIALASGCGAAERFLRSGAGNRTTAVLCKSLLTYIGNALIDEITHFDIRNRTTILPTR